MTEFQILHFIRPYWLWCLPLAIAVPWFWRYLRRPSGDWARICDPHLLKWLSVRQGEEISARGKYLQSGIALLIAILALAGPSWEKLPDQSFSSGDSRVIALDLSLSMLAGDLKPNRLTQARYRLADLLDVTIEGQVGMVSFAGDAYVVSPLTSDMNTIANLLPALQPDIVPVAGSRADLALELSRSLLERAGLGTGEVLLVTDSADSRVAAKARELRDGGYIVSVLGVGTADGAPIPSGAGFVNDQSGNVVITRLERQSLRDVAAAGGGRYSELSSQAGGDGLWQASEGSEFSLREEALGERWKDMGPWLVLLLLPLAMFSFRQGLLFSLSLLLLPAAIYSPPASADVWGDMWQRKDQQAWQALQEDEAEKAASLANDPALAGQAWYRSGEYGNAVDSWMRANSKGKPQSQLADLNYNRANALAHAGELDAAIEAYDAALSIDPDMEDAVFNRALVEQMKEEQEQQKQQDGESQDGESSDEQQESEDSEQSQEEESEEGEQSEQQEGEDESQSEGENTQSDQEQIDYQEAWSEEDAQAMEQWLNRIPDDPGGLLRRKFRNEHQRRGAPADERKVW
jgi:Ca-activated chloride channel family protein